MEYIEDKSFQKIVKLSEVSDLYDVFFFDIWGVLHEGGEVYHQTKKIFNELSTKKEVRIISNAPRRRETIGNNLRSNGLIIEDQNIFTSGEITRLILNNSDKHFDITNLKLYHIGAEKNHDILSDMDVNIVNNIRDANLIVLSAYSDSDSDSEKIIKELEVASGYSIPLICCNPDTTVIQLGNVRLCAGYFGKIYEKLNGKVLYSGKPESLIFEECIKTTPETSKILMIGDTFETDIHGAANCMIDSAMVITGNMGLKIKALGENNLLTAVNKICSKEPSLPNFIITVE